MWLPGACGGPPGSELALGGARDRREAHRVYQIEGREGAHGDCVGFDHYLKAVGGVTAVGDRTECLKMGLHKPQNGKKCKVG